MSTPESIILLGAVLTLSMLVALFVGFMGYRMTLGAGWPHAKILWSLPSIIMMSFILGISLLVGGIEWPQEFSSAHWAMWGALALLSSGTLLTYGLILWIYILRLLNPLDPAAGPATRSVGRIAGAAAILPTMAGATLIVVIGFGAGALPIVIHHFILVIGVSLAMLVLIFLFAFFVLIYVLHRLGRRGQLNG